MTNEIIANLSSQLIPALIILCILILIILIIVKNLGGNTSNVVDSLTHAFGIYDLLAGVGKRISDSINPELIKLKNSNKEYKIFRSKIEDKLNDLNSIFLEMEKETQKNDEVIKKSEEYLNIIKELEQKRSNFFSKIKNYIKIKNLTKNIEKNEIDINKRVEMINNKKEKIKSIISELLASVNERNISL